MITSTAERNTAQAGGAFAVATSGTYLSNAAGPVLTVSTTSTSENRATDDGGALHALDARTLVFLGSSLRNVAGRHGGAAFSTTTRTDANVELRLYGTRVEANEVRPRGLLSRSMPCLQLPSCPQSQRLQDMNGCERAPPPAAFARPEGIWKRGRHHSPRGPRRGVAVDARGEQGFGFGWRCLRGLQQNARDPNSCGGIEHHQAKQGKCVWGGGGREAGGVGIRVCLFAEWQGSHLITNLTPTCRRVSMAEVWL